MAKKSETITKKPKKSFLEWIKANRTFTVALGVILLLMITSFVLAKTLPAGKFVEIAPKEYEFEIVKNDFPFWQFILSPFLLFGTSAGKTVGIIVSFLFIISGVMEIMNKSKVLNYVFDRIVEKFKNHRYLLLVIIVLFFMMIGALIGFYDEIVPFVPLLIILVARFGYDKHIGIAVSLFAVSVGFAAGIFNPFTVAIPQKIAGVTQFSGMWMRLILFVIFLIFTCIYVLLKARANKKAKSFKVKDISDKEKDPTLSKASIAFGLSVLLGFTLVILTLFVDAFKPVRDYSLLLLAGSFLLGGVLTTLITKMSLKDFIGNFAKGLKSTLMAAILLILASSIFYILKTSQRLETILYGFVNVTIGISPLGYVFICYALFLLFGLFIASGSTKALLLIPILFPIAEAYDVLYPMFLAFALADGMVSLMYPTNPILIVILNITKTDYGEYIKKNWIYFLGFFILSILIIVFSYLVGYNAYPF